MFSKANVNGRIKVKLTPLGVEHWKRDANRYLSGRLKHLKLTDDKIRETIDADGYHCFQIWEFMEIFGAKSGMCMPTLYDNDILIETTIQ
jgi:hypothetical protein